VSEAHLAHVRGRRGFRRDVSSGSVASPPRRGESLDPGLTSYLADALASALDFAHTADEHGNAAGIIHRDISPSNVLLSNAGEIKLADFGIAKAMNLPGSIQSGALKGKVPYIS